VCVCVCVCVCDQNDLRTSAQNLAGWMLSIQNFSLSQSYSAILS